MSTWASEQEIREQFEATYAAPLARDFRVYDEFTNEEGSTGAKVDLIEHGVVVHTETFWRGFDDGPCSASDSAYGWGGASSEARSYAWAWIESLDVEVRLEPFGPEWQREQEEEGRS
jgi:hypothetical protein